MRTSWIVLGVSVLLLTLAASAEAATLKVGKRKPYATIGEAVAAASPGDTIVVYKGRYRESVEVTSSALTFKAKGGARWLPAEWKGDCLTLRAGADGATISGFTFSTTGEGVVVEADRVTITRCRFRGGTGIRGIGADELLVSRCDIRWGERGVRAEGNGVTLDRCRISQHDEGPVEIEGDDATLTRVTQNGSENDPGFDIVGDGATVDRCRVRANWNEGIRVVGHDATVTLSRINDTVSNAAIHVDGDRALVESNIIEDCLRGPGIDVSGEAFTVRGNRIENVGDGEAGIYVSGAGAAGATVEENDVRVGGRTGIEVDGQDVLVRANRAEDCVSWGMKVRGFRHRLEDNLVIGAGMSGYRIEAAETEVVACEARECEVDGFRITSSGENVVLQDCRATDCSEGLHNEEGASVRFSGCTFLDNFQDVSNLGFMTEGTGNSYESGGPESPPID